MIEESILSTAPDSVEVVATQLDVLDARRERGWKLLMASPSSFLNGREGLVSKTKLMLRFSKFSQGEWLELIYECRFHKGSIHGVAGDVRETALNNLPRGHLHWCKLASCRLFGKPLRKSSWHPATDTRCNSSRTWRADLPALPREPIPVDLMDLAPQEFDPVKSLFGKTFRTSKKGSAGGLSGMAHEHLRPLLDSVRDTHLLFLVVEQLTWAQTPPPTVSLIRQGRLTALSKGEGGRALTQEM